MACSFYDTILSGLWLASTQWNRNTEGTALTRAPNLFQVGFAGVEIGADVVNALVDAYRQHITGLRAVVAQFGAAGQIAKIAGAKVVGIAGGPRKCRTVVEEFGFDSCIDYKHEDVPAALRAHCPGGVNVRATDVVQVNTDFQPFATNGLP